MEVTKPAGRLKCPHCGLAWPWKQENVAIAISHVKRCAKEQK